MENNIADKSKSILQIMAEHGYVTAKEFEAILGSERRAFRHIKHLMEELKFIESFPTYLKPQRAFCLTGRGAKFLASCKLLRVAGMFKPTCDYGSTAFYHNLALVNARLAFEKHPHFLDIETPRVLLSRLSVLEKLKPDAELIWRETLTPETQTFRSGLEIELHPKTKDRNIQKMRKFDVDSFSYFKSIIWVYGDSVTLEALRKSIAESKVYTANKHRFIAYNDLIQNGVLNCKITDYQDSPCDLF